VLADIDVAVELFREAARHAPTDYPDPAGLMHNLAGALSNRAGLAAAAGLAGRAAAGRANAPLMQREAARLAPPDHPHAFRIFGGLAGSLLDEAGHADGTAGTPGWTRRRAPPGAGSA
jgi:hypothetical protein